MSDPLSDVFPTEVVTHVFETLLNSVEQYEIAKARRALCQASPNWRNIIMEDPRFWTTIFLSFRTCMTGVQAFMGLSGSRRLHVTVDFHQFSDYHRTPSEPTVLEDGVAFRLGVVLPFASRFVFHSNIGEALVIAQKMCRHVSAANLRNIEIWFRYPGSTLMWGHRPTAWFDHPQITSLYLRSVYLS